MYLLQIKYVMPTLRMVYIGRMLIYHLFKIKHVKMKKNSISDISPTSIYIAQFPLVLECKFYSNDMSNIIVKSFCMICP